MSGMQAQSNSHYDILDAAASGDIRRLRTLLDRGANINGRDDRDFRWGMTPLMCAAEEGHLRAVRELLRRGAKVNLKDRRCFGEGGGYTALHYAISSEHVPTVDILIEAGADVNAVTQDGTGTPLMQAVSKKSTPIVDLLLKAGADPNVVEKVVGQTALRIAAQKGDDTLIRILIKNGAKVDLTDEDDTPLIRALWQKHFSSAELLLKDGADPNFPGHDGFTPLMWAVMSGYDGIVRKLIAAGADLNVRNDHGHTALDMALREGNREVAAILEQAGARTSDHLPAAGAKKKLRTPRLEVEVPDLSRSASSAEYNSVIRSLEIACGKKAEALMANCDVGVSLLLPKEQLKRIIAEEHHNYLESGSYIFECVFNRRLGVLPTTDKYAVVAVIRTSAPNDGKSTADIINWLRELEKEQPFELTGIGRDFLSGKFLTEIKQPMKLAKRLAKFCPDIFEPLDSIAQGAAELRKKRELFLWWD
jgi:ankyrin repeat protein